MSEFQPDALPSQPVVPDQPPTYAPVQPPPYVQAQQPLTAAPAPVAYVSSDAQGRPWILAVLAGLLVGTIVAFAYAAITFAIQREILIAIMAIGMAIGFTVRQVSGRPGLVSGIISVLIAVPATLASIVMLVVFLAADSIPEGIKLLGDLDYGFAIHLYFGDGLSYVWFAASLLFAFLFGRKARARS